jgi:hypothetical protein
MMMLVWLKSEDRSFYVELERLQIGIKEVIIVNEDLFLLL